MQVPGEFVQSVMPQGQLRPMEIQARPADFGAQVGQTLQQAGNEAQQQAIARQQNANETAVNDVYATQFLPAFQKLYGNFYALQGKNAVDQRESCLQSMEDLREGAREGLSNSMQQRMFDAMARRTISMEQGAVIRYADQQDKLYQTQASNAAVQGFTNITADKYNDPQRLQAGLTSISNEIARYGALAGQSDEVVRQRTDQAWDRLYKTIIERQSLDPGMGPEAANTTFQNGVERGLISGVAQLDIARYLKPSLQLVDAQKAYGTATGGDLSSRIASAANQSGVDPKTALTIASIESGLNPSAQNPDSSARGLFQHLDSTWQELGGTPENRDDPNAQIALGIKGLQADRDALATDLKREPQPWELYLAHQQGVAGARSLLQADKDSPAAGVVGEKAVVQNGGAPDTTVGEFLATTRNLVSRKSTLFTDQGLPSAQSVHENYDAGLDAVTGLAKQEHPDDPQAVERYRNYYIQQAGQSMRAQEIADQTNREVLRSGLSGADGAKSWAQFLSDPKRAQAYADTHESDPGIYEQVDKAVTANALDLWDPPASAETNALRDQLKGMQSTDRTQFSSLDLMKLYGVLPANDLNDLASDQHAIRSNDQAAARKLSDLKRAEELVAPLFKETSDSGRFGDDTVPYPQKFNRFIGQFDRAITNWQQNNNGKIPSDSDVINIGKSVLFPGGPPQTAGTAGAPEAEENRTAGEDEPKRDPFSQWVAGRLQEAGKVVSDETIKAAGEKLSEVHPGIEKDFRNMRLEFSGKADDGDN